jgi:hypothetical protein
VAQDQEGCVDLWIKWSKADDRIESHIEHRDIPELAARYGDESSVTRVQVALKGPGDIERRAEVTASVLEISLRAASTQ